MSNPLLEPEEVTLLEAIPNLLPLAGFLLCWGFIVQVDAIAHALFGAANSAIGWIPYADKVVGAPLHKIEQKITSFLGAAEQNLDGHMALYWHRLARLGDRLGRELRGLATLGLLLAQALVIATNPKLLKQKLDALWARLTADVHRIERWVHGHDVTITRITHTVAHNVYPRLRVIEQPIAHVIEPELAGLRARTRTLEEEFARAWAKERWIVRRLGLVAMTGLVAVALGRMGSGWIRCSRSRQFGRALCGMPQSLLDDLLSLVTDVLILSSICDVLPLAEAAFTEIAGPFIAEIATASAALCGQPDPSWSPLAVPTLHLPAASGVTLHLP